MNDKAKSILETIKEQINKISPNIRKMLIATIAGVLIFSIGMAVFLNSRPYEVLFTGLTTEEASEIMTKLQETQVEHKYSDGTITVPTEIVDQLKAQLVFEGYPKSGFTYGVFSENISMMSTDFEQESYKIFELQDRIASTIRLFEGVKDAKVTIAMVEDKKYVLDANSEQQASASVVVIMKNGGSPTEEQVKGIQHLLVKSIPKVDMEGVVVLDGNGNDVSLLTGDTSSQANEVKIDFEKYMDDSIRAKVLNMLAPIYGLENVTVSVKTSVDIDKKISEIINYDPSIEGSDKGIISSETGRTELNRDGEAVGGIPGTENNAEIPTYGGIQVNGDENYLSSEQAVDYYVDQLKQQIQSDAGSVDDITISVAINGENLGGVEEGDLISLIGNAAGINQVLQGEKIAIVAIPFFEADAEVAEEQPQFSQNQWIIMGCIIAGVCLFFTLLLILLLRKRKKKGKRDKKLDSNVGEPDSSELEAEYLKRMLDKQQGEIENKLLSLSTEASNDLKNKVRELSDQNPEISAQLIKTWLQGEEK